MTFSEIFIRRPVATILLIVGVILAGVSAYSQLPVAALPQADFPTINVSAQLAGASPDTMASSVATPLIKQFETIAGIDTISASSSLGNTQITIQFDLSRDIDAAAADVQAAIARAQRQLPDNLTTPPSYRKANPADAAVLILALTGDGGPLSKMDDVAENIISPALSTISGVAQAQVFGAKAYAVRIEVDPRKLDSRGLSLNGLASTLSAANNQSPVGTLQNGSQALTVDIPTQRADADAFKTLIIAQPGGRIVRLGDVAKVQDSVSVINQGSWLDGKPSIALAIQRQPGANTVAVVDAILAKVPELQAGPAVGHAYQYRQRRLDLHSRFGERCRDDAGDHHRPRCPGDLPVSEARFGNVDPCADRAALADFHGRLHVCPRLFHRQYLAAWTDAFRRARRR